MSCDQTPFLRAVLDSNLSVPIPRLLRYLLYDIQEKSQVCLIIKAACPAYERHEMAFYFMSYLSMLKLYL